MMKKKTLAENYLERRPSKREDIRWKYEENSLITLEIDNKGIANKLAQLILKKPKTSYVHLDEMGSFIWPLIDGEKTITEIGTYVKEHFKEKAEPLYERLAKYFAILESYDFIKWNNKNLTKY